MQVFALLCVGAEDGKLCDPLIGLITLILTEGNTYLYCAASSPPLREKTQRRSQVSGRISGAVVGEYHQPTIKYLITNYHSLVLIFIYYYILLAIKNKKYKNIYLC